MKWGIRYIQIGYWGGGIKTDRGYEGWLKYVDGLAATTIDKEAVWYYDINAAYRRLSKLTAMRNEFYYLVEEIP